MLRDPSTTVISEKGGKHRRMPIKADRKSRMTGSQKKSVQQLTLTDLPIVSSDEELELGVGHTTKLVRVSHSKPRNKFAEPVRHSQDHSGLTSLRETPAKSLHGPRFAGDKKIILPNKGSSVYASHDFAGKGVYGNASRNKPNRDL